MTKANPEFEQAFILHARPYRNTSLIIEFFSKQHGRMSAVSRGGRAKRAKQLYMQAFTPLLIDCIGYGELQTLRQIEPQGLQFHLQGNHLLSGLYLNELLLKLLAKGDAHPSLYDYYIICLQALRDAAQVQQALRCFEKQLLQELGYALQLDCDAETGDAVDENGNYYFHPDIGVKRATDQVAKQNRHQTLLFKGSSLLAIHRDSYQQADALRDAKRLMRMAINHLLGNKPLKSRELLFHREVYHD